jgi:hypothetical protein
MVFRGMELIRPLPLSLGRVDVDPVLGFHFFMGLSQ